MKWNKYTLTTTTQAVDMVSYTLSELGICGVEIEDKIPLSESDKKKLFIDILPELGEDDGMARVSFYIDESEVSEKRLSEVRKELLALNDYVNVGPVVFETSQTADEDWINNWKAFWKPFKVDEQIMIKPSWERLEDVPEDMMVVELDPGTAFGTGMHHTTRLCITQMKKYLKKGQKLLDVGCGSGILSIIGLMLGANEASATDIDPLAVEASIDNAKINGIDLASYHVAQGDLITQDVLRQSIGCRSFDMVVANILADIIIPLSAVVKDNMKPGALFISSGIINTKEADVQRALLENGFEILEKTCSGDWVAFTARA